MNNFTLPNYFEYFESIFSEEIIDTLITIEKAFELINYEQHKDDIGFIFTDYNDKSGKDFCDITMSFYRDHINSVLSLQGILLTNPYTDQIIPLAIILRSVSLLSSMPLSDILEGDIIDTEETTDVCFARVISLMSDLSIPQVLSHIFMVIPDVITYLNQDLPISIIRTLAMTNAEKRFKECSIEKKGIIVEAIRAIGTFGYNVQTFLIVHSETIADIIKEDTAHKKYNELANEIILLVLGSSTPDNFLLSVMLEAAVHIVDDATELLKVNNIIEQFMRNKT